MPFSVEQLVFYTFATILVGAAVGVITVRNPVYAALFLVLSFFTSAALWLLLEAEFLGIVLVLVYVGAVMVLFLFVVMMLDINITTLREGYTRYAPLGVLVAILMAVEIGYVVWAKRLGLELISNPVPRSADYSNTEELGAILYTVYVYPFEIAAVILLVGIVAAITLTMRRRESTRHQDPARQIAVQRADRVRIVKVPAEKNN
ncbi:MAG: NADH-quinone oxidoreductase subunit J [Gammaproteobacteria bacterium]|nr:NADH-quinone oxidoreductase subunit J [Gammaproteobacteria bacterium]